VRLSLSSKKAIQAVITGDVAPGHEGGAITPYATGRDIDGMLRSVDGLHLNVEPTSSRGTFVQAVLEAHENRKLIPSIIAAALNPGRFAATPEFRLQDAIEYLNTFLRFDGHIVALAGNRIAVTNLAEHGILASSDAVPESLAEVVASTHQVLARASARTSSGDFEGAVTLARSALEMMLEGLNTRLPGTHEDAKGDLLKLFKSVQKRMNLDPAAHDVDSIKEVLRGFVMSVNGLARLRNKMGDAHPTRYRVKRHHAVLAINAVTTLVVFIAESVEHQGIDIGVDRGG
jgi:hypothetical protein